MEEWREGGREGGKDGRTDRGSGTQDRPRLGAGRGPCRLAGRRTPGDGRGDATAGAPGPGRGMAGSPRVFMQGTEERRP